MCRSRDVAVVARAEEGAGLRQQSLNTAVALSNALDQEVAAMNYLLKGLSTSPALRAGDDKSFYDQLTATPRSGLI
jgi:two-component system, NarL family, sensor kinase